MPDYRTKRQKLEAMARQTASPREAEVARGKLAAMDGAKAPEYRAKAHEFRFSRQPEPTSGNSPLTAEDLARVNDELRRAAENLGFMNSTFGQFFRSTFDYGRMPPEPPPCGRCRHPHMATLCWSCGPLGPCGSICQRCRHNQHRGGVCYWCTPLSIEQRRAGPCAPGYDANWDAYVSGTECPRCHAGHHSPIYCTGTEAQP